MPDARKSYRDLPRAVPAGTVLDPRIYGLPIAPACLDHLRDPAWDDEEWARWRRRNLQLPGYVHLSDYHFTPAGQVEILLARGYTPDEIGSTWPHLAGIMPGAVTGPPAAGPTTNGPGR